MFNSYHKSCLLSFQYPSCFRTRGFRHIYMNNHERETLLRDRKDITIPFSSGSLNLNQPIPIGNSFRTKSDKS